MQYETGINYFDLKKKRQEALEVASKCNPGKGKMIASGVRGIDLHPQIKPSHVTRGIAKQKLRKLSECIMKANRIVKLPSYTR